MTPATVMAAPQDTAPDPMVPVVARVRRRRRDLADVWTLDLEAEDPAAMAFGHRFSPGQFNMLTVFGVGEVPISVSGDPADPSRLVHTIRAVGPVSAALAALKAGAAVGLRGPFGIGWPMAEAEGRDVVVIAGGLGLAPLRPALYHLLAQRKRFGKVSLLYGARGPSEILFRRELQAWRKRFDIEVEVTVDHAAGDSRGKAAGDSRGKAAGDSRGKAAGDWHGNVGVVTSLMPYAVFDPANSVALVCGPEVMMRFAVAALGDAGVPDEAVYLSMERNMKCAVGFCGHCQYGPDFVCKDGPVFRYDRLRSRLTRREI